ncbi:hypothetical protein [Methylobacterium aquaticum]|uniref:Uncharacterized protein n=1 Tax=Methylobacterium aquaticum TaxID=270351 RepID=A0A0J6S8B3_9HYPH|nr:hypothetical protein [Methylobacterium aquaticum]KMO29887.1 hypothetical protein VP06_23355 [Methylobacterium aquaticum]
MTEPTASSRTYAQSCALLDGIVGRCVRDAAFSRQVLADPEAALAPFALTADEMEDFLILRAEHLGEAERVWTTIRDRLAAGRGPGG